MVLESPWNLTEEHFETSERLWQIPVLKPTELALSEWKSDIDSQMKMEMVDFKNKNLLLWEYIHSLFGTFVKSNKLGPWKKNVVLKNFWKVLEFYTGSG